ncbi:hypothetical protein EDB69_1311 [Vibrio crassostreae]|uniref:three component ABC system middle component n=1 Tax=Vibrio TaxID=662 RepID=UPI0006C9F803|nr:MULTISPECIES: three component ABC system middle component [Vibrio]KPL99261.1 hypothetical protein AN167_13935 [Vibrio splendidus]ROO75408.1 hypothetical protein EDB64_0384 [Vibrio crassostreae]ROP13415.1 hypothetical protein EDB63_0408 [Vibrio crassostreae]ROQ87490.1 hypothetical protein EDB72_1037 [Vibrio crassostreae]ROR88139.1 hypothetical protein EDB66_1080 [Vibrio crassostreae]
MSNQSNLSNEEAALYNSAYLGFLLYSAIREYKFASGRNFSTNLAFILVPLAVNQILSTRLPKSTTTSLDKWVGENDGYLFLVPELVKGYVPSVIDAIEFLVLSGTISIDEDNCFVLMVDNLPKGPALFTKSSDMKEALRAAKHLGKWLSQVDSDVTIYTKFGVRP